MRELQNDKLGCRDLSGTSALFSARTDLRAKRQRVVLTMEPQNRYEAPKIAIHEAAATFRMVEEVGHLNAKICFVGDQLQLSEGKIRNNFKTGVNKVLIGLVQIREFPERKEPGTGESDDSHLFRANGAKGYTRYLDKEHGSTPTAEYAVNLIGQMSLNN